MTKDDIVRKLTSRKFWLALALFVSGIITAAGGTADKAQQIAGLVMQGAAVVAYMVGEGLADSSPTVNEENFYVEEDTSK